MRVGQQQARIRQGLLLYEYHLEIALLDSIQLAAEPERKAFTTGPQLLSLKTRSISFDFK